MRQYAQIHVKNGLLKIYRRECLLTIYSDGSCQRISANLQDFLFRFDFLK